MIDGLYGIGEMTGGVFYHNYPSGTGLVKGAIGGRIAAAEAPSRSAFWPSVIGLLEGVLPRPKVAFSYVAALAVLGVAAGSVTAQLESAHLIANLSARYVQSVDPYHAEAALP